MRQNMSRVCAAALHHAQGQAVARRERTQSARGLVVLVPARKERRQSARGLGEKRKGGETSVLALACVRVWACVHTLGLVVACVYHRSMGLDVGETRVFRLCHLPAAATAAAGGKYVCVCACVCVACKEEDGGGRRVGSLGAPRRCGGGGGGGVKAVVVVRRRRFSTVLLNLITHM